MQATAPSSYLRRMGADPVSGAAASPGTDLHLRLCLRRRAQGDGHAASVQGPPSAYIHHLGAGPVSGAAASRYGTTFSSAAAGGSRIRPPRARAPLRRMRWVLDGGGPGGSGHDDGCCGGGQPRLPASEEWGRQRAASSVDGGGETRRGSLGGGAWGERNRATSSVGGGGKTGRRGGGMRSRPAQCIRRRRRR
jgi:hypothetical protein